MNHSGPITADYLRTAGGSLCRHGDPETVRWLVCGPAIAAAIYALRWPDGDHASLRLALADVLHTAGFPAAGVEPLWQALEAIAEARS